MARDDYDDSEFSDEDDLSAEEAERNKANERGRRQLSRGAAGRLSDRLSGGARRPGQEQITKSPFLLLGGGIVLILAILAGVFYIMIDREGESRRLKEAVDAFDGERYQEAEQLFDKFIELYPETDSTPKARIYRFKTVIQMHINSRTPNVVEGLDALERFIKNGADLEGFADERGNIFGYANRICYAGAFLGREDKEQQFLDVSLEAYGLMKRYAPEDGIPPDRNTELLELQAEAEAEILKNNTILGAVAEIEQLIADADTIGALQARRDLIDRYPVLRSDSDLRGLLDKILEAEKGRIVQEQDSAVVTSEPFPAVEQPPLSLTLRTQATTDQVSRGQLTFGIGADCLYAVDADTGKPEWRLVIGRNAPFAPIPVSTTEDGLLIYSPRFASLAFVRQKDGTVIWRRPMDIPPDAAPLVHQEMIYLTLTAADGRGVLTKIALSSGDTVGRTVFPQRVIGPPVVSRDDAVLILPGDRELMYTLAVRTMESMKVTALPHRAGSIQTAMQAMGDVYLLCDNDEIGSGRLRVLRLEDDGGLIIDGTETVQGEVRDPVLLRGDELFVASSPQQFTAFRVTDDPDEIPLSLTGTTALQDVDETRKFMMAGPGGQLWVAGNALRKFRVRTNELTPTSGVVAEGIHQQPIRSLDDSVFVTTQEPYSQSVFLTRADREKMAGIWRTVLSTRLVATGLSATGNSLLAVTDYGRIFRVSVPEIRSGGFLLEGTSEFRIPDDLVSPVNGLSLPDGRLAAWCGGEEPAVWTITSNGLLERRWNLPGAPEADPVAISGAIVVPTAGRLHLTGYGSGSAEDYRAARGGNQDIRWKTLVAISDTQVLAIDSTNKVTRLEYRTSPTRMLAEISVTPLDVVVDQAPAASEDTLFFATADGRLQQLASRTLELKAEMSLGGVPSATPYIVGNRVFVEVAGQALVCAEYGTGLNGVGQVALEGAGLAGSPLLLDGGGFLMVRRDGVVLRVDDSGNEVGRVRLGQSVQAGLIKSGNDYIAVTGDGSLQLVPEF